MDILINKEHMQVFQMVQDYLDFFVPFLINKLFQLIDFRVGHISTLLSR